jgi:Uma2 family endonuclease
MFDLIAALKRRYQDVDDVYVAGNLFLYYLQGDPRSVIAPDVFLVKGVPKGDRGVYKLWEEGEPPVFVVEVTSNTTRHEDLARKKACYERLGVEEYFLHDPTGDYLTPRLQGFRLAGDRYQPIRPNPDGSLDSRTTGLTLRIEETNLRLVDTATGERFLWVNELADKLSETSEQLREAKDQLSQLREVSEQLNREKAARQALEDEVARLRRELGRSS